MTDTISSPTHISLSAYLGIVREVIELTFESSVWVKAEITALSQKGGHYYLELAEKDPDSDKTIAICRATLWKGTATRVLTKFKNESGIDLSKDLNVLVKVSATFHIQYGFSVSIEDIDASFTLGDIARKYQETIRRLVEGGLIGLNRALPTPFDIEQVLVISPQNAAGLGDFQKDAQALEDAGLCQFTYYHSLFQGVTAAAEIQRVLKTALMNWGEERQPPDLIVIIRGGGAVNDLAYLNDFDLAALLAKRKVPVWVGIGHERDRTILDEVAHRSFDTPSKVIAGIRNHIVANTMEAQANFQTIKTLAQHQLSLAKSESETLIALTRSQAKSVLSHASKDLDMYLSTTQYFAEQQIRLARQLVEQYIRETVLQSPKQTLERGFAIIRKGGHAVKSVQEIDQQEIQIELQDGSATAQVTHIESNS